MNAITMTPIEIEQITGYKAPTKQLSVLHERGFVRAYVGRHGVVLERAHYEAVCRGEFGKMQDRSRAANLDFLRTPRIA